MKNTQRTDSACFLATIFVVLIFTSTATASQEWFNISDFGAKGDGATLNTAAINKAIETCAEKGGGIVSVPAGTFLSGTVFMKSDVSLHLEHGAVLKGVDDLDAYTPYIPAKARLENADPKKFSWNRALILGVGVRNVSIFGEGTVDGSHVFDPNGEEKMRGPHAILFAESRNISFSRFTVDQASNYGILAFEIENAVFENLAFTQGWDGIHVRGGKQMLIRNCSFHTGDDAIAGGFWTDTVITDCEINSSCNGIRIIMPVENLQIANSRFYGPGLYPHRTSKERKRTDMLSGILIQPGGWGKQPGPLERIHIHDIEMKDVNTPLMIVLNEGNDSGEILVERLKATGIAKYAASIESWKGGVFDKIVLRDVDWEFKGHPEATVDPQKTGQPATDPRNLPCWGLFAKNIKACVLENVNLRLNGSDPRPVMRFDNVDKIRFEKVDYTGSPAPEKIVRVNSGPIDGE